MYAIYKTSKTKSPSLLYGDPPRWISNETNGDGYYYYLLMFVCRIISDFFAFFFLLDSFSVFYLFSIFFGADNKQTTTTETDFNGLYIGEGGRMGRRRDKRRQ